MPSDAMECASRVGRPLSKFASTAVLFAFVASCGTSGGGGVLAASGSATSRDSGATGSSGTSSAAPSSASASSRNDGSATPDAGPAGDASGADATQSTCVGANGYDALVLCDHPVAYWAVHAAPAAEPDLTGNGHAGTYTGGPPPLVSMPNGDTAADFNGSSEYLTIASSASFSIPTAGDLTFEGWIRPDVLQFPHDDGTSGYVDWMGKCDSYGGPPPTCEWEARMYDLDTKENPNRPNRLSAYVFNPTAGLGSAADWQPATNVVVALHWLHVVGEYTTKSQPADCPSAQQYPGSINIWVNGVPWSQSNHDPTGCMSQYAVVPQANGSAVNIGTMARDSWFQGAIGKVAIYDYLLTQPQINRHYETMTGMAPAGSCADTCTL